MYCNAAMILTPSFSSSYLAARIVAPMGMGISAKSVQSMQPEPGLNGSINPCSFTSIAYSDSSFELLSSPPSGMYSFMSLRSKAIC